MAQVVIKVNFKSSKRKDDSYIHGKPIRLSADFLAETVQARGSGMIYSSTERKKSAAKITLSNKAIIQKRRRDRVFQTNKS